MQEILMQSLKGINNMKANYRLLFTIYCFILFSNCQNQDNANYITLSNFLSIELPPSYSINEKRYVDYIDILISSGDDTTMWIYLGNNPSYPDLNSTNNSMIVNDTINGFVAKNLIVKNDSGFYTRETLLVLNRDFHNNWPAFVQFNYQDLNKRQKQIMDKAISTIKFTSENHCHPDFIGTKRDLVSRDSVIVKAYFALYGFNVW